MTYKDVIETLEKSSEKLYVAVIYHTDCHEWLPVDKEEYIRQLSTISNPETIPYPCWLEIEPDGEMFIHPKHGKPEDTM